MGQIKIKIVVIICCFIITGVFIYQKPELIIIKRSAPLSKALAKINDWTYNGSSEMGQDIVDALALDDYINSYYSKNDKSISLYIGYYFTSKKVGAAHSPLVCFPGQGWILSENEQRILVINNGQDINFKTMVITRGSDKQLILYWFQAFDKTSPGTFMQKINVFWNGFYHSREDNAFIRISVSMDDKGSDEAVQVGLEFLEDFYPVLLKYITDTAL